MIHNGRPTQEEVMIELALVTAKRSTCSRLNVGAVLAQGRHVVSTGYNGAPSGLPHCVHEPGSKEPCTISIHAEANAIVQAARYGVRTQGGALFLTHAPCLGCSGLILNAGITHVYFRTFYRSNDGIERLRLAGASVESLTEHGHPGHRGAEKIRPMVSDKRCVCGHIVMAHDSGGCAGCACSIPHE